MAPKRGGSGGGSSGGGSSSFSNACPHAFSSTGYFGVYTTPIDVFVAYCLYWVALLALGIAWRKVKKNHPKAKKLIGPLYAASIFCTLFAYSLLIIATMLRECGSTEYYSYYYWRIPLDIFSQVGLYFLLVIVLWGLNESLRDRLGNSPSYFRIVYYVVLGFMGILTLGFMGFQSYNTWTISTSGQEQDAESYGLEELKLEIAYYVFYLLAVFVAGGFATMSILSMRSQSFDTGNLLGKVITLFFSMSMWILFTLIENGSILPDAENFSRNVYIAFFYIEYFFQILSWVMLLVIAKSAVLKPSVDSTNPQIYNQPTYTPNQPVYNPAPVQQQQYPPQQQYYYQQQPIYNGTPPIYNTPPPGNGYANGQMVQVK